MQSLQDKVAAVTGVASGIGRATAILLARRGAHVALSDVDEVGLADTARACEALGVRVTATRVDVADRAAMHRWADDCAREFGRVNVIVNNAGVALGATIEDMAYEDLEWLMGINFWGVVHGTKAFLPHCKRSGDGHVVNVSSVFGLIAVPSQAAYNAAKFAVRGFTEALREEMELEGAPVGVTCVHPGGIRTNIARAARMSGNATYGIDRETAAARFDRTARTTPETAAAQIVDAILHNRRRQLIGVDAVVIDLVQRLLPTAYQWLLVAAARRVG
jgi:NAD(P)-dependent dehydrogenase (short-subunit alcohol dehydrogenase family)